MPRPHIKILVIGKTKHSYLQEGIQDYLRRLKHYAQVEMVEIRAKRASSKLSDEEITRQEARLFAGHINPSDYVIALDRQGQMCDSIEMARALQKQGEQNPNPVAFLIGGELGLSPRLVDRANEVWSFSKLTFSHDMVRLILVEQLYRGFTIMAGEKYHK